jgi:hypothetical protein
MLLIPCRENVSSKHMSIYRLRPEGEIPAEVIERFLAVISMGSANRSLRLSRRSSSVWLKSDYMPQSNASLKGNNFNGTNVDSRNSPSILNGVKPPPPGGILYAVHAVLFNRLLSVQRNRFNSSRRYVRSHYIGLLSDAGSELRCCISLKMGGGGVGLASVASDCRGTWIGLQWCSWPRFTSYTESSSCRLNLYYHALKLLRLN